MKTFKFFIMTLTAVLVLMAAGCKEDDDNNPATVNFKLTDAPANYDALYIDVQGIEVHNDVDGWVTVSSSLGVIDLLTLVNGNDTLIATSQFSGNISQVRLILGTNNSIVVNGTTYPLTIPSGYETGLKIDLHQELQAGATYEWTIDFDASKSIVLTGSSDYKLKPVLRAYADPTVTIDGAIYGSVSPIVLASVCAINAANDTMCTMTSLTGGFTIQGLAPGTYTVLVEPPFPLTVQVVSNVTVTANQSTDLGLIVL